MTEGKAIEGVDAVERGGAESGNPPRLIANPSSIRVGVDKTMRALMESYIGRISADQRVVSVRIAWQELWYRASRYLQKEDLMRLGDAFVYSSNAHSNQRRHNGDPYIIHTLGTASILSDIQMDIQALVAALLHDVIEDTEVTPDEIGRLFGDSVLTLVDGVTKLGRLPFKNLADYQGENLRKMFLVMAKDVRVVLIKLADRSHNMSTITGHRRERQLAIATETMEIYAPLAHRLGIYHIKRELEDLSFRVIDPEMYYDIKRRIRKRMPESENAIKKAMETLSERLREDNIKAQTNGRMKHYYSIYEKMKRKNLSLDQVYDLMALRVIVNSLADCYQVLGIVHALWKPIPGQFDDYIANPKGNMYQSLHSTVVGPDGEPLEIQIRTWEMHRLAEYGIAAHWQYKENKRSADDIDLQLAWIRKALETQGESSGPSDFLEHIKTDVLSTEVFVFTPQGKVISMPNGSTPIDFAYSVHTEIGNKCVGAMVNGRIVPMDYVMQNGDIVRILTSPQGKPSRDWLKIAKSNRTRNKIRSYFRQIDRSDREDKIERGRDLLFREIQRRYPGEGRTVDSLTHLMSQVSNDLGYAGVEDLIVSIGNAHQTASGVMSRIESHMKERIEQPAQTKQAAKTAKEIDSAVVVDGADGVLVNLAMCCCPVPGDKIVGSVTHSRGITIHRSDCANLERAADDKKILVKWGKKRDIRYTARIKVEASDRLGLFADLGQAIHQTDGLIVNIRGNVVNGTRARLAIDLQVWDLEHLYRIFARINSIKGMMEITRG
ncbi:MAG: bifunctional (p)ppGpp synthetase/guanosine-3',5'-bis(diphosphate) 3'-pyrophosphohydrolase [Synergistaceae bacterium]|jgi:GTP pyrophosphokinase|nr:bifunctional (p)ppGpp synthetase/guanosine-3',5'-bis(diphosphate) 3'-pyrophosphohydrolase [Synergistaceae bacterium]